MPLAYEADKACSNNETDHACDGACEGYQRQRKGLSPNARGKAGDGGDGQICRFNDEPRDAGIPRAAGGLKPSSHGKRIAFDGTGRRVIDGSFTATRDLASEIGINEFVTR